ncbi:MAG: hypothetical protein U9N80_07595 [Chloroflexota bacterium]|nr:hypothetical protein [Chloroflexota bacterium]
MKRKRILILFVIGSALLIASASAYKQVRLQCQSITLTNDGWATCDGETYLMDNAKVQWRTGTDILLFGRVIPTPTPTPPPVGDITPPRVLDDFTMNIDETCESNNLAIRFTGTYTDPWQDTIASWFCESEGYCEAGWWELLHPNGSTSEIGTVLWWLGGYIHEPGPTTNEFQFTTPGDYSIRLRMQDQAGNVGYSDWFDFTVPICEATLADEG